MADCGISIGVVLVLVRGWKEPAPSERRTPVSEDRLSTTGQDEQSSPVPASLAGERVDRAVALLTGWSRADVVALIDAGDVVVGGDPVRKSRKLVEGDEIVLTGAPEVTDERPVPEPVDFTVVHADERRGRRLQAGRAGGAPGRRPRHRARWPAGCCTASPTSPGWATRSGPASSTASTATPAA